ncbi:MAG: hypothetical protein AAF846_27975 [Chloroflexota bacterium]
MPISQHETNYLKSVNNFINNVEELFADDSSDKEELSYEDRIKQFAKVLKERSNIRYYLNENPTPPEEIETLFFTDEVLRQKGRDFIREHKINMYHWRESASIDDKQQWWWYLEQSRWAYVGWLIVTLAVFISILQFLIPPLIDISALAIRIFSNAGIEDSVFDTLAILGTLFQLAIGGSISLALTRTFSDRFNALLQSQKRIPPWIRLGLPVPPAPILLAFFSATLLVTQYGFLPQLEQFYANQADRAFASGAITEASVNTNIAMATNSSSYVNTLTLIGREYENIGELDLAKETYQEALLQDSTLSGTRYLLANLLLDEDSANIAIRILDDGIQQINEKYQFADLQVDTMTDEQRRDIQLLVLLLTSRGRAFLQLDFPDAAFQDIRRAESIISDYDEFFLSRADIEADNFDGEQVLNIAQFYYYDALINEALALREVTLGNTVSSNLYETEALDAWESVLLVTDQGSSDFQIRLWNLEASQRIRSQ